MNTPGSDIRVALPALLICPNQKLAEELTHALAAPRQFEVLSVLRNYPESQTLGIRIRQAQPEIVFVELTSDPETGFRVIRDLTGVENPPQVIAIHGINDSGLVLQALQAGASDFLASPFPAATQREAATRVHRLRRAVTSKSPEFGRVIALTSAKPGSGASILAIQTALSLRKLTGQRVLLIDLDLLSGTVAFTLKLKPVYSLLDAIALSDRLDPETWSTLTVNARGVDVLAAPEMAAVDMPELGRLLEVLEYARLLYDWVVVDLPTVFHRLALSVLSETDQSFVVSTPDIASLHLGRRAVHILTQLGFDSNRFGMIVNRTKKKTGLAIPDMEEVFGCPVLTTIPNDSRGLHSAVAKAEPLPPESPLSSAVEAIISRIDGAARKLGRTTRPSSNSTLLLSHS